MAETQAIEAWLRGPVPGIPQLLQPIAHALIQAREEVNNLANDFPNDKLWDKPAGMASVGFHLRHLAGVLDRLFSYARAESLSDQQLTALKSETHSAGELNAEELLRKFNEQVDKALYQLSITEESSLTEFRAVGRARLPSTVHGLLFHAAEHTMRHVGQLLVTVQVVKHKN